MFCKKDVPNNCPKFTEKHLRRVFFSDEVTGLSPQVKAFTQAFSCKFCEIFKNIFFLTNLAATS